MHVQAVASYLKLPAEDIEGISGHSVSGGATQDLLALNVDMASVMRLVRKKGGTAPLSLSSIAVVGDGGQADDFTLRNACVPILAPRKLCAVFVTFNAVAAGPIQTRLC